MQLPSEIYNFVSSPSQVQLQYTYCTEREREREREQQHLLKFLDDLSIHLSLSACYLSIYLPNVSVCLSIYLYTR